MKSTRSTRRVNLSRLRPVADPFRCSTPATPVPGPDPDEPPPCPACGGETLRYIDPQTGATERVCPACVPYQPTNDEPEDDIPR